MFKSLSRSPIFKNIKPDEIPVLLSGVNYTLKKFKKGQVIALREEPCNNLMILVYGSVKGEMLDFSGKTVKIEDIAAPNTIASAFLFGTRNQLPVDIVAKEDVQLLFIPKSSVITLLKTHNTFLTNFLDVISDRSRFLSNRLYFLTFTTIKEKLAQYILSRAKPDKTTIEFPKTQQDLAEFFGITRPSLARVLGELVHNNIISIKRNRVNIIRKDKLIELIR